MKYCMKTFFAALLIVALLPGCRPDDFKDIGEPRDVVASLGGVWKLTKATQIDEDALGKAFPGFVSQLDLTTIFPYTDFALTLNLDNNNSPSTFTSNPGNSPAIMTLTSGTWNVDNWERPSLLIFKQGSATQTVTLGSLPTGGNTKLKFKVEKRDAASGDKLLISYTYEFTKQ